MRQLRVYYSEMEESRMRRCSNSPIRHRGVCLGLTFLFLVLLVVILPPISVRIFSRPTSEPLAGKGEFHIQFMGSCIPLKFVHLPSSFLLLMNF